MKRFLFAVTVGLVLCMLYAEKTQQDIENSVVRLHLIANSDSVYDQQVKYAIRDKLLSAYGAKFQNAPEGQVYETVAASLDDITKDVNQWLREAQVGYRAKASFVQDAFPTKAYGESLKLPAGEYRALKVVLGDGAGQNWWCVCFPPLCFAEGSAVVLDAQSDAYLKEKLTAEEYRIITEQNGTVWKFKLLELWQEIKDKL